MRSGPAPRPTRRRHSRLTLGEQVSPDLVTSRHSLEVPAGERVSFATYFNGFPAAYWHRWTVVSHVSTHALRYREPLTFWSTARTHEATSNASRSSVSRMAASSFELPLVQFRRRRLVLVRRCWVAQVEQTVNGRSVDRRWFRQASQARSRSGITTFNRPDYCVDVLRTLAADEEALARIDNIFVVDQGSKLVEEDPGFDEVASRLGQRLFIVRQPNLGGSGGFSRSMYETAYGTPSKYVLLLDDDVLVEPEGILRAVTFADLCRHRTIVGGHMLNMHVRSMIHAWGERVNKYRFFWGPAPHTRHALRLCDEPVARDSMAAPTDRRGLQRLVDVPDPHRPRP